MYKYILPHGECWFATTILALAVCLQFLMHSGISENIEVTQGLCTQRGFDTENKRLVLKVDCDGKSGKIHDAEFIAKYLEKPTPLYCTLYESERVKCNSSENDE